MARKKTAEEEVLEADAKEVEVDEEDLFDGLDSDLAEYIFFSPLFCEAFLFFCYVKMFCENLAPQKSFMDF